VLPDASLVPDFTARIVGHFPLLASAGQAADSKSEQSLKPSVNATDAGKAKPKKQQSSADAGFPLVSVLRQAIAGCSEFVEKNYEDYVAFHYVR